MNEKKFNEKYEGIISGLPVAIWMTWNFDEKRFDESYKKIYSREKLWTIIEDINISPTFKSSILTNLNFCSIHSGFFPIKS